MILFIASDLNQRSLFEDSIYCDAEKAGRHRRESGIPNLNGQDRDYLIMALRAYRDDKRESSVMHKMSLPYSDTMIEGLASLYANRKPE